jgi:DNA-3-methyladenine glycosylase
VADDPDVGRIAGRIVEVEAYIGEDDRASHARFGPTARNAIMYRDPGLAYLYLVYGMHTCLNVVTEPLGRPAAVLIRAVELDTGIEAARTLRLRRDVDRRRTRDDAAARARDAERVRATPAARLASGPGLVGAAFGLDSAMTGLDLCDPASPLRLEIEPSGREPLETVATPRIGIDYAGEPWVGKPWRFVAVASPAVSGPRVRR